ncbi:hypothetical protein BLNAU_10426 [Blattamonas nauphoetae]|uniref:Uncharacterized protein n=1 Tax=Blattamonas nauphoetae TaxID=2049346 RepID=A0ABQ9XS01_9EUKA|nr:hypothetical protein BLNAU_10426 [Blattamonas nauphoetae]
MGWDHTHRIRSECCAQFSYSLSPRVSTSESICFPIATDDDKNQSRRLPQEDWRQNNPRSIQKLHLGTQSESGIASFSFTIHPVFYHTSPLPYIVLHIPSD